MGIVDPRREKPRIYFADKEIALTTESGYEAQGLLLDISERGVGIVSSAGFFVGDKVTMRFEIFGKRFLIAGEVKRVSGKEIFVKFGALTADETEQIQTLIEEHGAFKKPPKPVR